MKSSCVAIVSGLLALHSSGCFAQSFVIPAAQPYASKVLLGHFDAGSRLHLVASGQVNLTNPGGGGGAYETLADGSLAAPWNGPGFLWAQPGATNYPTFAGGDGINHYPGGGANWQGAQFNGVGAQSTDTTNPATIRFGTLVGTFKSSPSAADWFVIGIDSIVVVPPGGAYLYAAVSDCTSDCYPDNSGAYNLILTPLLDGSAFPLYAISNIVNPQDAGAFAGGSRVDITASGTVDLYDDFGYTVHPDGSISPPIGVYFYANPGATDYPTVAGGDGINHYPGGGANWALGKFNIVGAASTDTLNPETIRFGTVMGSFTGGISPSEWFVVGTARRVTIPAAGSHLYLAVSDCADCPDNQGYFTTTVSAAPACPVDVNGDNVTNSLDLAVVLSHFGQSVPAGTLGDVNFDGMVNTLDLAALLAKFGTTCP